MQLTVAGTKVGVAAAVTVGQTPPKLICAFAEEVSAPNARKTAAIMAAEGIMKMKQEECNYFQLISINIITAILGHWNDMKCHINEINNAAIKTAKGIMNMKQEGCNYFQLISINYLTAILGFRQFLLYQSNKHCGRGEP